LIYISFDSANKQKQYKESSRDKDTNLPFAEFFDFSRTRLIELWA